MTNGSILGSVNVENSDGANRRSVLWTPGEGSTVRDTIKRVADGTRQERLLKTFHLVGAWHCHSLARRQSHIGNLFVHFRVPSELLRGYSLGLG